MRERFAAVAAHDVDPANQQAREALVADIVSVGIDTLSLALDATEVELIGDPENTYLSTSFPESEGLVISGSKKGVQLPIALVVNVQSEGRLRWSDPTYTFWSNGEVKKRWQSMTSGIQQRDASNKELEDLKGKIDEAKSTLGKRVKRTSFDEGIETVDVDGLVVIEGIEPDQEGGQARQKGKDLPEY